MEQITAFFQGIDVDALMNVVADYVTKIDINQGLLDFGAFFRAAFQAILGGLSGILGEIVS